MKTLQKMTQGLDSIPAATAWTLADLREARGKQELFVKQSPQKLKVLREHSLIESAISSNRIEGVEVEHKRIGTILFGKSHLRDRDEQEVRGYREALALIHEKGAKLSISEKTILRLHALSRGNIGDAGKYKEKDGNIIEKYPDGRIRIRFKPVSVKNTPSSVRELIEYDESCEILRKRDESSASDMVPEQLGGGKKVIPSREGNREGNV
jgi:Fic family protein